MEKIAILNESIRVLTNKNHVLIGEITEKDKKINELVLNGT